MKFKTILADPPWSYKTYSDKGKGRSADNHYDCMSLEDIKGLSISSIADKDSTLFLWVTVPFLDKGMEVIKAWGFTYKSCITWVKYKDNKLQIGTGYRVRNSTEMLLIASKGKNFCPEPKDRLPSAFLSSRLSHSEKPEEQYKYLDPYPGPCLELFARKKRDGWTCLGNEIDGKDIRDSLQDLTNMIG